MTKLYEQPELRKITGATLHPGGLELTRRGLEFCAFKPGAKLLDIGCGPGESLRLMRGMGLEACGLDKSKKLLAEACEHGPVILGEAENIPLQSGLFDGVTMECVLSLMNDKALALHEAWRVLKPGGRLLLSDLFLRRPAGADKDGASCPAGAETLPRMTARLGNARFTISHSSDETKGLAQLAVNMVFKYGSPEEFFRQLGLDECPCSESLKSLGYIIFIANKPA